MPARKFYASVTLLLLTYFCSFSLQAQTFNKAAKGVVIRDTVRLEPRSVITSTCSEGIPGTDVYLNINGHRGYEQTDTMEYGSAVTMSVGTRQICWWKFAYPDPFKQDSALQKSSATNSASFSVETVDYVGVAGVFVRGSDTIRPYFDEDWQRWTLRIGSADEPFSFVANGLLPGAYASFGVEVSGNLDPPFAGGSGGAVVIVPKGCPVVELSKNYITPGDTITIKLKEKINDTTIVELPPHQGFYLYLTSGEKYGRWIDGEVEGNRTFVTTSGRFVANNNIDVDAATVIITGGPWFSVKSECGTAMASVTITKGCPAVVLSDSIVYPKDTINVYVKKKNNDSTFADYKEEQLFNIRITEGGNYGDLFEVNTGRMGDNLEGVQMPVQFIAVDSIDADSASFTIEGNPVEPDGPSATIKQGKNNTTNTRQTFRVMQSPTCEKPKVKGKIQYPIDSVEVTNCLEEMLITDEAKIKIKTYIKKAETKSNPPEGTLFRLDIGFEGTKYAKLKHLRTGQEDTVLENVSYAALTKDSIIFTGNGTDIPGKFPLGVRIFVSATVAGKRLEDYGTVFLKSSNTTGMRYSQSEKPWDTAAYDSYKKLKADGGLEQPEHQHTIREKGCAMSCMAMMLKAYGNDYDPYTLNKYMNETKGMWRTNDSGNYNGNVNFYAIPTIDGNFEIIFVEPQKGKTNVELSTIDQYLNNDSYVIANVKNGGHWVLITGKNNGVYSILDPAGSGSAYCKNVVLDVYKKNGEIKISKIRVIKRK